MPVDEDTDWFVGRQSKGEEVDGCAQARWAPSRQRGKTEKEKKNVTNPYAKSYKKHVETKRPKRKAAQEHTTIRGGPRLPERQRRTEGAVSQRPSYLPGSDALGNQVWDGGCAGLGWYASVKAAMDNANPGSCQIGKSGCTGRADFATVQAGLAPYEVCDGRHRFPAVYKTDVLDALNGGNTDTTAQPDVSGLQWSCTHCNSSKSCRKGVYENVPVWTGTCPGNCGYTPWGNAGGLRRRPGEVASWAGVLRSGGWPGSGFAGGHPVLLRGQGRPGHHRAPRRSRPDGPRPGPARPAGPSYRSSGSCAGQPGPGRERWPQLAGGAGVAH